MLHFIPRPVHAVLDYVYGLTALMAPKIAGFDDDKTATTVSTMMGVGALVSGLTTRHEGGVVKLVPFNTHLKTDAVAATLSFAAPWLFGFAGNTRARNSIIGLALLEAGVVLLCQPDPQ